MGNLLITSLLLLCLSIAPASAQVSGGSISGRVTDATGANIPNARIEIENVDTGQRITATSDAQGNYRFDNVPVGRYRVISRGTSTAAPSQEVTVELSRTQTLNLTLPTGPATDALVTADAVPVDSKPANVARNFNTRYIQYLPQPNIVDRVGKAFGAYNLSLLSEGVTSDAAVSGSRPSSNNFHLDGIDNNSKLMPGPMVYLSNEASNEFTLFHNQPSPPFGHRTGGNFNTIMRTGSNRAHGSIYNYLQNRNLNAMDPSFNRFGMSENPRYDQNRLGATLGLPIVPSKVFFFGNFEYIPLGFTRPFGGISYASTPAGLATLGTVRGVNPTNLGIFGANGVGEVGPATRVASVNGVNIPLGLVQNRVNGWQNQFIGAGALDFTFSEKDQLRARYMHNELESNFTGSGLSAFQSPRWNRAFIASLAHYHVFGDRVTNELRVAYTRHNSQFYPSTAALGNLGTFPNIQIGGDINLAFGPQFTNSGVINTYHLADGLSFRLGSHTLRVGADARRFIGSQGGSSAFRGNYIYSGLERFLLDLPPDVLAERAFGANTFDLGQWHTFGYIQDTWNAVPGFTLDLGLRYQYSTIPQGLRYQGLNAAASVPGLVSFEEPIAPTANFAPNVGFAWSPGWTRMTVIRGGFGMHYDAMNAWPFQFGFAPQLTRLVSGNLNDNAAGFLAGGGILDPTRNNTGAMTPAQARATVGSFIGNGHLETPYSMQWNFGIQQAFWRNGTIELKYLGNRGVHLPVWGRLNGAGPVSENMNLPIFTDRPAQAVLNRLTLTLNQLQNFPPNAFAQTGFRNPINTITFDGNSWYHGFSAILNHKFTGGFQFNGNYTWSQFTDDSTGTTLDIGVPLRTRTWSMYDRRHRATATGMWELAPLFVNRGAVLANIFADFNLSGTYTYESAPQLTPLAGMNTGFNNNALGTRVIFNPSGTPGVGSGVTPLTNSQGAVVAYLVNNPSAQFFQGGPGTFSGFSRGGLFLRETNNFDIAVSKRFNFMESASLELRGEAYNIFNHPQVTGGSINTIGFRSALLMPNFLVPGTADFNNFDGAFPSNSRTLQLALRFVF